MKIVKEKSKRIPIFAGEKFKSIREVGYKIIEFTFILHPDGDKQLVSEKEIKRVIK